jgi:N-acetylglucosamine-6-sulfatase
VNAIDHHTPGLKEGRAAARPSRASRRRLCRVTACTVLLTMLGVGINGNLGSVPPASPDQASAAVKRPNILVIVIDDQKDGTVTPQIMPNVYRELVQRGVTFDNGFVTNSWCCPSRASILTGQYSHTNGVWTVGGSHALAAWRRHEQNTLATWLHGAGYRTALIGKYMNHYGESSSTTYAPPGWDVTDIMMGLTYHTPQGYYNYDLYHNGRIEHYGSAPDDYSTRVLTRKARSFFASDPTDTRPKFAYVAYTSVHGRPTPDPMDTQAFPGFQVTEPPNICETDVRDKPLFIRQQPACTLSDSQFSSRYRSEQARMLVSVDRGLGQLFGDLTRTGQIKNTIIIYISDNGSLMSAHRIRGKELPYEESIDVPLLFRWDALGKAGLHLPGLALNIDIAPTITNAIGLGTHDAYDGMSLLPLVRQTATSWRRNFLVEHLQSGSADPGGPSFCAVRGQRYLYAEYSTGEKELYDLSSDPWELTNLVGQPTLAAAQSRLHARLLQLCNPPPPGWSPTP